MNINLTLFGQTITFIVFVMFCMKFIWPPLMRVLNERKKTIADGLAEAGKGRHELELAEKRCVEILRETKSKAADIIEHAEKRAGEVVDESKVRAKSEAEQLVAAARTEIEQESNRAREHLRLAVADLAIQAASKILEKEIDPKSHSRLIDDVVKRF